VLTIEISSNNFDDANVFEFIVYARLKDYPNSTPGTTTFQVTLINPCLSTSLSFEGHILHDMEVVIRVDDAG
jgi:hypothetical protein